MTGRRNDQNGLSSRPKNHTKMHLLVGQRVAEIAYLLGELRKCEALFASVNSSEQLGPLGVEIIDEADESTTGPASFMTVDPDGNTILIDQHI